MKSDVFKNLSFTIKYSTVNEKMIQQQLQNTTNFINSLESLYYFRGPEGRSAQNV